MEKRLDFINLHATSELMEIILDLQLQVSKIKFSHPEKFKTNMELIDRLIKVKDIYFSLSGQALFHRLEAERHKENATNYLLKIREMQERINFLESINENEIKF